MHKVILRFNGTESKEEIHEKLKEALEFPDYYGRNLDALYDCLTDLQEETAIGFIRWNTETEKEETAKYLYTMQRVFREAEEENPHLAVFFPEDLEQYDDPEGRQDSVDAVSGPDMADLEDLQIMDGVFSMDTGAD